MATPTYSAPFDPIRKKLDGWRASLPDNFYAADPGLQSALLRWLGKDGLNREAEALAGVGRDAAGDLNAWGIETNRDENLPRLERYDSDGRAVERIVFHPRYHDMGRRVYGSGILQRYATPGQDVAQMAMFYLFSQNGEAGHNCPLACTTGAVKLLQTVGSDDLKRRWLPRLTDPNYDTHFHAAQFLTELQGGSDVGANETAAVPQPDGSWRLYGEKWFCSVADAQLWVLTARPQGAPAGTKGLTTFFAPRLLDDGRPNHFRLKRLKYKTGTRSMATGEFDLDGTVAWAVGKPGEGFKYVVDIVLNTSRLYNAFAAAGMARRAYVEAKSFAAHRDAFGAPIAAYPLVKRSLAFLRLESALQLASSLHVAALAAKIAAGAADEAARNAFRFLVNATKYRTAIGCTKAVHEAIEIFGGNGAIEEFSILPRLYRDAIVIESWEGAHNVLCQQVLRDMGRYHVHQPVFAHAAQTLDAVAKGPLAGEAKRLRAALDASLGQAGELLSMPGEASALHIRPWIDRAMTVLMGVELLAEADVERVHRLDTGKAALVRYHLLLAVDRVDPFGNAALAALEAELAK